MTNNSTPICVSPLQIKLEMVGVKYLLSQTYETPTILGPITLRRGDAVYVRAENGKNLIAQIDSMWTAPNE